MSSHLEHYNEVFCPSYMHPNPNPTIFPSPHTHTESIISELTAWPDRGQSGQIKWLDGEDQRGKRVFLPVPVCPHKLLLRSRAHAKTTPPELQQLNTYKLLLLLSRSARSPRPAVALLTNRRKCLCGHYLPGRELQQAWKLLTARHLL